MLTVLALAGTVGACGTLTPSSSSAPAISATESPGGETGITVVDRGRHTDIVLAADALHGPVEALRQTFPNARYLVFGFGDRAYLMAHGAGIVQTISAIFPGPGLILVTGLDVSPQEAFGAENVVVLRLSCARLNAIEQFVARTLAEGSKGEVHYLGDGPYPGSAFYATETTYDLLHDCNRWTAEALRQGGFAIVPEGVIIASQLMTQVGKVAAEQKVARNGMPEAPLPQGSCA